MKVATVLPALLLSLVSLLGAGCATTSPDVIDARDARQLSDARDGVVRAVRPITVAHPPRGAGAVIGAVVGGGGRWRISPTDALGALVGATAGHMVESVLARESAVEVLIELDTGRRVAVVQGLGGQQLMPGDRVAIIGSSGSYRVVLR